MLLTVGDPAFEEAIGVLNEISSSPEERQFYRARIRFRRDEKVRMIAPRMEGWEEAESLGQIKVYQQLLGILETQSAKLARLLFPKLNSMVADLQRLRDHG